MNYIWVQLSYRYGVVQINHIWPQELNSSKVLYPYLCAGDFEDYTTYKPGADILFKYMVKWVNLSFKFLLSSPGIVEEVEVVIAEEAEVEVVIAEEAEVEVVTVGVAARVLARAPTRVVAHGRGHATSHDGPPTAKNKAWSFVCWCYDKSLILN